MSTLLLSCSLRNDHLKIQKNSFFTNSNDLGKSKEHFISLYGDPINKGLKMDGTNTVETLYYVENIKGLIVTTKFKFVNNILEEQDIYEINAAELKFNELQRQLRNNDLQIFMNGLKQN
ncbi:hypothetical protein [Myroides sp. LJL119]